MSKLVLAEKPSVAQSIAKVLGADRRCDGYLEGNGYVVSWCIGHLVELKPPEAYNESYAKWRYDDLPILPEEWQYQVSVSTKKQYSVLTELMKREDVESLVCATDAGREGELIFRLVYEQARCRKPCERLWISSMEDEAIREGFENLKPGTEYDALYEAALCRERADWIVGMNATRLFSCLYRTTLNVGRVMTPTLAMVVMRDAEIAAFTPQPFYTVQLEIGDLSAGSRRFTEKEEAEALLGECRKSMQAVIKSLDRKEKTEKAPLLYDLTSLQRDANRILGFTAQQTLDYTQSLYEKKLVTYPRTDSRYLTEDMKGMVPKLVEDVAAKIGADKHTEIHADIVCDSTKVSDHHAIIPTKSMPQEDLSELPSGEKAILQLIAVRLLCSVSDPCRYAEDSLVMTCCGEEFTKKSRTVLDAGWKEIWQQFYPAKEKEKDEYHGPDLSPDTTVFCSGVSMKTGQTSPPKRFTEDTLLNAMETAGADDIPEDAERKGLGTPATRAGIIEKLVQKGFIERKGDKKTRYLLSTDKGNSLITVMPEQIQSASMTADWEQKLLLIERGQYDANAFMREINEMISSLVRNYEAVKGADVLMSGHKVIGKCPHCGAEVIERQKSWSCSNRECKFALWKDNAFFRSIGKTLTASLAEKLLKDGRIRLRNCESRKTGKTYDADLVLQVADDGTAQFKLDFDGIRSGGGKRK